MMWCLPLQQGWDRLLCRDSMEYTKIDSSPNQSDSGVAFLQHQTSLLNLRNLLTGRKAPLCQVQGTASAGGSQQSQQMKQTRLRRNNSTRVSNVPGVAVEKLGTEPGVLAPSPMLTAPHYYARHTDAAV